MCIMKNKLIDVTDNDLITIGSVCGVGKTTFLCYVASQEYKQGKNILFISQDESEKSILKKFNRFLKLDEAGSNKLIIKHSPTNTFESIEKILNQQKFDLLIHDCSLTTDGGYKLRELIAKYNISIIASSQLRNLSFENFTHSLDKLRASNSVYTLTIKKDFNLLEKIKYTFCFWLKKPNRTLSVVKNRYGANGKRTDFYLKMGDE